MFEKTRVKAEARLERERERFRARRTPQGEHVSDAQTVLYGVVIVAFVLLFAITPGHTPFSSYLYLMICGAAVLALSPMGQSRLVPPIYAFMAGPLRWREPYGDAVATEDAAIKAERQGQVAAPVAPAPADAGKLVLDDNGKEVLRVFFGLPAEERKTAAADVIAFFHGQGFAFSDLEDAENEDEKSTLAQAALRRFAKENGIQTRRAQT